METKREAELWQVGNYNDLLVYDCAENGPSLIAKCTHADHARRIVACVNACAGLTEAELGKFIDVRDALKASNAELAEALCNLLNVAEMSIHDPLYDNETAAMDLALAALAKLQP